MKGLKIRTVALALAGVSLTGLAAPLMAQAQAQDANRREFNIPAQNMANALEVFGRQSGRDVLFDRAQVAGLRSTAVRGRLEPGDALRRLVGGTGLSVNAPNTGTFVVGQSSANPASGEAQAAGAAADSESADQEIVVTGTNIRGAAPAGGNIITVNRQRIEQSGLATVSEVMRTIPQNYGGGPNEITSGGPTTINNAQTNVGRGSGVNLRGLGTESSLTLVNGRRVAANAAGSIIDISLVPLSIIERIEVLPDGASAIYGSDAIGGVVNIILRDRFEGAETRLRLGSVTEGNQQEFQFSQVFGRNWSTGHAVISYEYYKVDPLFAEERSFSRNSDLREFGGSNFSSPLSNPGNIIAGGQTYPIPGNQNGRNLLGSSLRPGVPNFQNTQEQTTILDRRQQHSVFGYVEQEVADGVSLFLEGRYAHRDFQFNVRQDGQTLPVPSTNAFFVDPVGGLQSVRVQYSFQDDLGPRVNTGSVDAYALTGGVNASITSEWSAEFYGSYSRETFDRHETRLNSFYLAQALADSNPATAFNPFGDGSNTAPGTIALLTGFRDDRRVSQTALVNGKIDGRLFELPGGSVRTAFGVEYRDERRRASSLDLTRTATPLAVTNGVGTPNIARNILSAFGELSVPIFSEQNAVAGFDQLRLSLAVRYSDYSDVGSSTNPRFGIDWVPTGGLRLRGSYGTSFRAPNLNLFDIRNNSNLIFTLADRPEIGGSTVGLVLLGSNTDSIGPERATTWTLGADLQPPMIPGLRIGLTYFDIDYRDRIASAIDQFAIVLTRDDIFAPIVTRNPSLTAVNAILTGPVTTTDTVGIGSPSDIRAIVDLRTTNISASQVRGLDGNISYGFDLGGGRAVADVTATYYLDYVDFFTETAAGIETVGTVGKPVDFAARGSLTWSSGAWSGSLFGNFVNGYRDNQSTPNRSINSYTTFDARLAYTGQDTGLLSGTTISVSVRNLFDRDPPFFNNLRGIAFDPEKANPQGRFVALEIVRRW